MNRLKQSIKNSIIPQIILSSLIAAVITAGIVSAASTIGTNINTTGTLTVSGTTALNGLTYTWPGSQAASTYLQTDGAGALSWAAVTSASPDWVKETNYGALNLTASTTIPYWVKDAIYASSTLQVAGNAIFESNLGIGTSSPYAKLSVVGQTVAEYFTATSTTATSTIAGGLTVDGTSLVVDYSSNNVGIGTAEPQTALDILGIASSTTFYASDGSLSDPSIAFSSNIDTGISYNSSQNTINFVYDGSTRTALDDVYARFPDIIGFNADSSVYLNRPASDVMAIFTSSAERMRIDATGFVGIGTTSPSQALHVFSTTATTTVEFGDISSSTAKTCFNINQVDGSAGSFYFNASGIVFEQNACQ